MKKLPYLLFINNYSITRTGEPPGKNSPVVTKKVTRKEMNKLWKGGKNG